MSRGDLQEMDNPKLLVNSNTKAADPSNVDNITPGQSAPYEDLGGPTPENL